MKHLSKIGLVVSFEQNFLHEFDYTVSNLAVDLRDGLRLARLAEILMAHASRSTNVNSACGFDERMLVSKQLRVPVISRLQKVFNVKTAIRYLQELGVDMSCRGGEIRDVDICDGHRHKTLALLWKVIAKFDLGCQVNIAKLSAECKRIGTPSVDLQLEESAVEACSAPEALALLRWTDTICAVYNKRVNDFSLSFADGRALCFLIHHYHPAMLPLTAIAKTTMTQSVGEDGQVGDRAKYEALLAGERKNFQTVNAIVQQLGHMPFMLSKWDSTNVPEEKTMIVFLAYLHERLMDSYEQVMATQTLQRAWRNIKIQRQMAKHLTKVIALQYRVRRFLAKKLKNSQRDASITIQKWLKRMPLRFALSASIVYARKRISAAKELQYFWKTKGMAITRSKHVQAAAATKLQQNFRRFLAVHRFNTASQSCIKMQAFVRGSQQKRTFYAQRGASTQLQATVRAWIAKRRFATAKFGIIQLQSLARSATVRSMFQRQKSACVAIQAVLRGFFSATQFNKSRSAVSTISSHWRMHHQSNVYKAQRDSAIAAQACIRGFLAASKFQQKQLAADVIQSMWRSMVAKWSAQQTLADAKTAATTINAFGRQIVARAAFARAVRSAIRMQATIRGFFGATQFTNCRNAVTTIAAQWRMHHQFTSYKQQRAAVVLQSWWKSMCAKWSAQQTLADAKTAATTINAFGRQIVARMVFARAVRSAIQMQAIIRGFFGATHFYRCRNAVTTISAQWRMSCRRGAFVSKLHSITVIQSIVRAHIDRRRYGAFRAAATLVSSQWRRVAERRCYLALKRSAIVSQAAVRAVTARTQFVAQRAAAVLIANAFRRHLVKQAQQRLEARASRSIQALCRAAAARASWKAKRAAAIAIVSNAKRFQAQRLYNKQKSSAIRVQACVRKLIQRQQFCSLRQATTTLSKNMRASFARQSFMQQRKFCVAIQQFWKTRIAVARFADVKCAALTCQRIWRASHKVRRAATRLQCWTRVIAAQKVLQALQARAAEIRREQLLRRQQKAAKTIKAFLSLTHFKRRLRVVASAVRVTQSFIRGYRIRKKNTKKLQMIRQRLREANRKYSKALSIGALSNQALTTLLTNKSLAAVMHACSTLEMVTRYSRNCSRHFIEHDATNILFKLMASSNRSEPHQKLIIVCLGIIKNLRAWGQLISSSTHLLGETEMLTLVDLLQNYREKPAIAIRSLTLFVQELSQPDLRECIRNNAPVMRRLNSIRNLSAKKAKALKTSARANTSTNRTAKKRNSANTMHALMTKLQKMLE